MLYSTVRMEGPRLNSDSTRKGAIKDAPQTENRNNSIHHPSRVSSEIRDPISDPRLLRITTSDERQEVSIYHTGTILVYGIIIYLYIYISTMSTTPTPTPPPPDAAAAPAGGELWRNQVLQSYRNEEVREIAKVLAELEPGATTSSKLMLAMRFEDSIFKSAASLEDYRKIIAKRLKKLKKNYKAPEQTQDHENVEEQLLLELRTKYSSSLKYIAKNAVQAVEDVKNRLGTERSIQLQQHTDSAIQWGKDLGILEEESATNTASSTSTSASTNPSISISTSSTKKRHPLKEPQLRKLQQHLERRLENIRQYVVKHADPDLFLQETLERKDQELPSRACTLLAVNLSKRIQQIQHVEKFDGMAVLQESLEKAQAAVQLPTRNNANEVPRALLHLEKIRAASTALMAYFSIPDRKTTAPRNALAKAHTIAIQGMEFCKEVAQKRDSKKIVGLSLLDAWTKTLEVPSDNNNNNTASTEDGSLPKKPKLDHVPPVIKSRVLLKPNRKTPSNLIPALKRKQAKLVRPAPHGHGTHLILEFENVFVMTIYLCPLVVTIRAMKPNDKESSDEMITVPSGSTGSCAPWKPLFYGLADRGDDKDDLEVWGISGNYQSIGHAVEERLRDASTHATQVLRKCFRNHVKDKTTEFEIEILEASALLEFLHLARTTYLPKWQDVDIIN
jgi:hypothetical protein